MTQLRYPNITGKTPEERQNQMERYVRSLVDQLNMQRTTPEPDHKQETIPHKTQTKVDWKSIYPVGAIFLSVSATSPEKLFGGKWEQITDRFLLATGSAYAAGSTGGEANHTLTVAEMPNHIHKLRQISWGGKGLNTEVDKNGYYFIYDQNEEYAPTGSYFEPVGNSQPHNNMPPYLAVYIWKRIA